MLLMCVNLWAVLGGGRRYHGDWFPLVFAIPIRQTLDGGHGL